MATLPSELSPSYEVFVANWCLGVEPTAPANEVVAALDALKRLWPDRFNQLISNPMRGLAVILPAIDLGRTLMICEAIPGFRGVHNRLLGGDAGALSELYYAAAMSKVSFTPELEPHVGTGMLDTVIPFRGMMIFAEVIAPENAEAIVSAQQSLNSLAHSIRDNAIGYVVEVLLKADISPEISQAILDQVRNLSAEEPVEIEGLATIIRRPASLPLQLGPTLIYSGKGSVLGAAAGGSDGTNAAAGIVRMPIMDARVRRLIHAELHHFSRDECNVLVIDMTSIAVGFRDWATLIRKSFQPTQNRRLGAVILFFKSLVGNPPEVRYRWAVLRNPHALKPVPRRFLTKIQRLDEVSYYRNGDLAEAFMRLKRTVLEILNWLRRRR